jgi:nucleoside phosphorylase
MGDWAKMEFGRNDLPPRCFLVAGGTPAGIAERMTRALGEVTFHRHDVYERYLLRNGEAEEIILALQFYGAPVVCDFLKILQDGGTKEVVFLGMAQGRAKGLNTGSCIVPRRTQSLDGVSGMLGAGEYTEPDPDLRTAVLDALTRAGLQYQEGTTVSVPATFWHGDESKLAPDVIALECEFAAFCHCSTLLGLHGAGVLVISDTLETGLLDCSRPPVHEVMLGALGALKKNLWKKKIQP